MIDNCILQNKEMKAFERKLNNLALRKQLIWEDKVEDLLTKDKYFLNDQINNLLR